MLIWGFQPFFRDVHPALFFESPKCTVKNTPRGLRPRRWGWGAGRTGQIVSWGLSLGTSARAEGTVQGLRCRWSGHKGEQTGEGCKLGDRARDRYARWSATAEVCVHMDTCRFPIEERVGLSCVVSLSSN